MKNEWLSIDFESHSACDIKLGAYAYILHPSTKIMMMSWRFDSEKAVIWWPGTSLPQRIVNHILDGGIVSGWNAAMFERLMWRFHGPFHKFPPVRDDQWFDPMHLAVANNLPRSLEGAAAAVGSSVQKDKEGHRLMLKLTSAKRTPDIDKIPAHEMQKFAEYCCMDTDAEAETRVLLPIWPDTPHWRMMPSIDKRINDRGVLMDRELIVGMQIAAKDEVTRLDREINTLTNGRVPKITNIEGLKAWLLQLGVPVPKKIEAEKKAKMDPENAVPEEDGDSSDSASTDAYRLRKNDIIDLLAQRDLPDIARTALEWRQEGSRISTRKLGAMLASAGTDDRLRGALIMMGAQQTARYSGAIWQPQNMFRNCIGSDDDAENEFTRLYGKKPDKSEKRILRKISDDIIAQAVIDGRSGNADWIRTVHGSVMTFIARMSRRTLCSPRGKVLIQGDFASVEARITAWVAQQVMLLDAYENGKDVYRITAAPIVGAKSPDDVSKEDRQKGKVAQLALGFLGGAGSLVAMGQNCGMKMTYDQAQPIVTKFRESNPQLVDLGNGMMKCIISAISYPGREFPLAPLGIITFKMGGNCLLMKLPTGRHLRYWGARIEPEEMYGQPQVTVLSVKGKSVFRRSMWRGLALENLAQTLAVELLVGALVRLEQNGFPIVLHVHDSIEAEVDEDKAEALVPLFNQLMSEPPTWSFTGRKLPIGVDTHYSTRFG